MLGCVRGCDADPGKQRAELRPAIPMLSSQVDRLLAVADFGPPEERDDLSQDGLR